MPDEEQLNDQARKRYMDTRVNKQGQVQHYEDLDLEPPMMKTPAPKALKKKKKVTTQP